MPTQLTAIYEKRGDWYIAYLQEIPGVNTQGRTKQEAKSNLEDALREYLEANRQLARDDISNRPDAIEEPFALVEGAA